MFNIVKNPLFAPVFVLAAFVAQSTGHAVAAASITKETPTLGNMANFDDCHDLKLGVCAKRCFLFVVPGVKFTYQEPTSIVETSCLNTETSMEKESGIIGSLLSGSSSSTDQQKCYSGIEEVGRKTTRGYNETTVWGISPIARYQTSADALDATTSLTCGIFGFAGKLMNLSSMAGGFNNFSMSNVAQQIKSFPQTTMANLQNSASSLVNQVQNIPQNLGNLGSQVQNSLQSFQNAASSAINGVSNLQNGLQSFQGVGNSLTSAMSALQNLPVVGTYASQVSALGSVLSSLGSLDVNDLSSLQDLAKMDFNAISQQASKLGNALATTPGLNTNLSQLASSLQNLGGISASTMQTAVSNAIDTLSAAQVVKKEQTLSTIMAADAGIVPYTPKHVQVAQLSSTQNATSGQVQPLSIYADLSETPMPRPDGSIGIMRTGQSEISAKTMVRNHTANLKFLEHFIEEVRTVFKDAETTTDTSDLCALNETMDDARTALDDMASDLNTYKLELYERATYLPLGFTQEVAAGQAASSCPRTHAGYIVVPSSSEKGVERVIKNCTQSCNSEGNDCVWTPRRGFAGSCEGNRLSDYQVNNKYPACGGMVPQQKEDDGEISFVGYAYDASQDERAYLNNAAEQEFRSVYNSVEEEFEEYEQHLKTHLQYNKIDCTNNAQTSSKKITPQQSSTEKLAHMLTPETPQALAESQFASLSPNIQLASTATSSGLGSSLPSFSSVTSSLNSISSIFRPGGITQKVKGKLGQYSPIGLYPAFSSKETNWATPPSFDLVGQIQTAIGTAALGVTGGFQCMASAYAKDYGVDSALLTKLNSLTNCVGAWGAGKPSTGYATHKVPAVRSALIGYRGHQEAVNLATIAANTKGTQQFNLDAPFIKDAGKHRGSGCYDVGTASSAFYTHGEKSALDPTSLLSNVTSPATDDIKTGTGEHQFTMWKKTSCCITPCGITRYY